MEPGNIAASAALTLGREAVDYPTMRSKVAVLKVKPETILDDIERLCELAGMRRGAGARRDHHPQGQHLLALPVPGAPTPRRGSWRAPSWRCAEPGLRDITCVQNKTVVTDAFKGEDLNHYVPIFKQYDIPVLYNFKDEDMKWVRYQPKAKMRVLDKIFPDGIQIPDYFFGKNIVHLPTMKCHIYTTTTGAMKNAFGGLLDTHRHYTHSWIHETLVDLLAIQKEIHAGLFAIMDGTTAGNGPGPRTMCPVIKDYMLASRRSGRDRRGRRQDDGLRSDDARVHPAAPTRTAWATGGPENIEIVGDDIARRELGLLASATTGAPPGRRPRCGSGRSSASRSCSSTRRWCNVFIDGVARPITTTIRWPLVDKQVFEKWRRTTDVGPPVRPVRAPVAARISVTTPTRRTPRACVK